VSNLFLRRAAQVTAAALAVPVAYSLVEPHLLGITAFDVVLNELPDEAEGLRVVQLSDLHISAISSASVLNRIVEMTNELHADLIVITGDFVSRRNSYLPLSGARIWARPVMEYAELMASALAGLHAHERVLAVPGNHDLSAGKGDAITDVLNKAGIDMLTNRNVRVRGFAVVGLDDLRAGRPDYAKAFEGVSSEEAQLVLSHNPRVISMLQNRNAMVLAGHTHAGQVHLPFTDYRRRPRDMEASPYFQGWYAAGKARLYIHSGLGSVHFPMRFRCPPEIAVFTLKKGDGTP
jgi:predicted MPP superfamily phosphohydrolase